MKLIIGNKRIWFVVIAIALAILLQFALALVVGSFEGTDDQAVSLIQDIAPGYQPWTDHLWAPGSDLAETLLFALQAAIGVGIIAYFWTRWHKNSNSV